MTRAAHAVASFAVLFFAVSGPLTGQSFDYSGALHYSTGDYIFSEATRTWTLANSLSYRSERFRITAGVPLVFQNSSAITYVGAVALPTGGAGYEAVRERQGGQRVPMRTGDGYGQRTGRASDLIRPSVSATDTVLATSGYALSLADPAVSGSVALYQGWGVLRAVDATASVKAPVRSLASGMGTGEWDYAGGLAVTVSVGSVLLFGDATYWRYGDLPEMELHDGASYAAGLGLQVSERTSLVAALSYAQRVIETVDPYGSLTVMGSRRAGSRGALNVSAAFGLTEASPDFSVAVGWRFGLGDPLRRTASASAQ